MPANVRSTITELVKRDPDRPANDILADVLADLRARPLDEILEAVTPLLADAIVAEVGRAQSLARSKQREEKRRQKQPQPGQPGQPIPQQVTQLTAERRLVKMDVWTDLRNVEFTVDGVSYTWGNATREVHTAAAKQHERDARQHRKAVRDLDATGRATLDELLDAAAVAQAG